MNLETAKRILGLSYALTEDELKSLYRKLCLELHPDVNKSPNAKYEFQELQVAYDYVKKNLPLLPPPPPPPMKGYKIYEIFKSKRGTVSIPHDLDEDILLHFFWLDRPYIIKIPLGTKVFLEQKNVKEKYQNQEGAKNIPEIQLLLLVLLKSNFFCARVCCNLKTRVGLGNLRCIPCLHFIFS